MEQPSIVTVFSLEQGSTDKTQQLLTLINQMSLSQNHIPCREPVCFAELAEQNYDP